MRWANVLVATFALAASTGIAQTFDAKSAAAAFGAQERILHASLSPDGQKVAFVMPGPAQATVVQVLDRKTGEAKPVNYADGKPMTLKNCGWVSNSRLVCQLYGVSSLNGGEYRGYARLIAMDADGGNARPLQVQQRTQMWSQGSDGQVIDWRDGSSASVLLARTYVPSSGRETNTVSNQVYGLGVDLVDTTTGKSERVEFPDKEAVRFIADGTGKVRIKATRESTRFDIVDNGVITFRYRTEGASDWKPFSTYSTVTDEGLYPIAVDGTANVAFALRKTGGRDALYRVALDGSLKTELVFAHPEVDVSGVTSVGRRGRIVAATYHTDMPGSRYFDPQYEKLRAQLGRALPKLPLVSIVDSSADETVHLIHASSDSDAGRYYVLDTKTKSLSPIGDARPQLMGMPTAKVSPISFRAADGTMIPGYLTRPAGSEGKKLPAIVMPHGGPASRDTWGFDWLAQFFAARGYVVLQPNFRGSSGYGEDWFVDNGFRSWKIAIGDVVDAGRYLVREGIADPEQMAIVGWSYGGYAALQANVMEPKLFKAAVAIAPVTDLALLRSEQRGTTTMRIQQDYIGQGPQLVEGSPAQRAAAIQAPVLLFHGTRDLNVSVKHAELMDRQLKRAGKASELVIYRDIDHQLPDSTVRADMLGRTDAFLAKALKLDAPAP